VPRKRTPAPAFDLVVIVVIVPPVVVVIIVVVVVVIPITPVVVVPVVIVMVVPVISASTVVSGFGAKVAGQQAAVVVAVLARCRHRLRAAGSPLLLDHDRLEVPDHDLRLAVARPGSGERPARRGGGRFFAAAAEDSLRRRRSSDRGCCDSSGHAGRE